MKHIYYSENSDISKDNVDEYATKNKMKYVTDDNALDKLLLSRFSQITFIISSADAGIVNKLATSVLVRKLTVITKDVSLVEVLRKKVTKLQLLDYTTESMTNYWVSPITECDNMLKLNKLKLRAVKYDMEQKKIGYMAYIDVVTENIKDEDVTYICIRDMSNNSSIKYTKEVIKEETKKAKQIVRSSAKNSKMRTSPKNGDLSIGRIEGAKSKGKIEEYLVANKFVSEETIKEMQKQMPKYTTIEQFLCDKGQYSKEDLVGILNNHLNKIVYGKEDFSKLVVEYIAVKDTLKDMGVIEAYKKEDTNRESRIIIIPYNADKRLEATIKSTINYTTLVYTIPDYIDEYRLA